MIGTRFPLYRSFSSQRHHRTEVMPARKASPKLNPYIKNLREFEVLRAPTDDSLHFQLPSIVFCSLRDLKSLRLAHRGALLKLAAVSQRGVVLREFAPSVQRTYRVSNRTATRPR